MPRGRMPNPKWKKFERRLRNLFKTLNFEDTITERDHWYKIDQHRTGNQIDVFGGSDGIAIIIDCRTTDDPNGDIPLRDKINKTAQKRTPIETAINEKWPNKYPNKIFAIATDGISISDGDKTLAANQNIQLIDAEFFWKAEKFAKASPESIKYQILKKFGAKKIKLNDPSFRELLRQPALKICSGNVEFYTFTIRPSLLLRLAYVNRLEYNPSGYQRKIKEKKIEKINEFLTEDDSFFANSILIAFDKRPIVTVLNQQQPSLVELSLPDEYASCEVIDGQHRLFGYLPIKKMEETDKEIINDRQVKDLLPIIAIIDENNHLRHRLFLDINANQSPVEPTQIWTQYGKQHPNVHRGYISNILKKLDQKGPLKDLIYKTGDAKNKKKIMTISFLGGVLERTKLLDKDAEKSLVCSTLRNRPYPDHIEDNNKALKILNDYFLAIKNSAGNEWPTDQVGSFIKSSYGMSIFIELLPYVKTEFEYRNFEMNYDNFTKLFKKIKDFLIECDESGKRIWEKATLTSGGTRRKALKHFVKKYLLQLDDWKNSEIFTRISR